jgi:hypothetical protein
MSSNFSIEPGSFVAGKNVIRSFVSGLKQKSVLKYLNKKYYINGFTSSQYSGGGLKEKFV